MAGTTQAQPPEIDLEDEGFWRDPHPRLAAARAAGALARQRPSGRWLVLRYRDVDSLLRLSPAEPGPPPASATRQVYLRLGEEGRRATREIAGQVLDRCAARLDMALDLTREVARRVTLRIENVMPGTAEPRSAISAEPALAGLMAMTLVIFAQHPDQLDLIRSDPGLGPRAIDEVLRFEPIVPTVRHRLVEPTVLGGQVFDTGDELDLSLLSAARDSEIFPDADRFDVLRARTPHFSLGLGARACPAAALVRFAAEEFLRALLVRRLRWEIDFARVTWRSGAALRAPGCLPAFLAHD